jgi:hypothetical protein
MTFVMVPGIPAREEINRILMAPFGRGDVRFKKGDGSKFYPYFDIESLTDRLIEATNNFYNFEIQNWEWREHSLVAYGHLELPWLGKRAGIGQQEHTSKQGNEMGADLVKGVRSDLLKNCALLFGLGRQVRRMDAISFDPADPRYEGRLAQYLEYFFPECPSAPIMGNPERNDGPGDRYALPPYVADEVGEAVRGRVAQSDVAGSEYCPACHSPFDWDGKACGECGFGKPVQRQSDAPGSTPVPTVLNGHRVAAGSNGRAAA